MLSPLHNDYTVQHCWVATNHTIWKGDFEGTMSGLEALKLEAAGLHHKVTRPSITPPVPSDFCASPKSSGYGLDNQNSIPD